MNTFLFSCLKLLISCSSISCELNCMAQGFCVPPEWRLLTTVMSLGTVDWWICSKLKNANAVFCAKNSFAQQQIIRAVHDSARFHMSNYTLMDPFQLVYLIGFLVLFIHPNIVISLKAWIPENSNSCLHFCCWCVLGSTTSCMFPQRFHWL